MKNNILFIQKIMTKSIFGAIACLLVAVVGFSSCNSKWDELDVTPAEAYGNNNLTEDNVITIAQLKAMPKYKSALTSSRDTIQVTDNIKLKLRVTGNDISGNIYSYISAQDENGDAILVYIYSSGLYAYLPVGQEILIDLKGLYVGANGTQPAISTPYMTSSGNVYPKNMPNYLWQQHMKLMGYDPTAANCQPKEYTVTEFATAAKNNMDQLAGKLITIKDCVLKEADGKKKWGPKSDLASENDFTVKRYINGLSTDVFVNTSTSAKFASEVMPTGTIDLTAVVVRYNKQCQLTLRSADDAKQK